MRRSRILPLIALLMLSADAFAQQPAAEKAAKPKKDKTAPVTEEEMAASKRRTERLFGDDAPLEFTLTADFKAVFKSRDTLKVKTHKATLTVKDSSGTPVTIPIEVSPRGHFRLRADVCNFPPIRLIFPKTGLKGTPFAGQEAMKLGTHCRQSDKEYAEYVVREHAVYEVLNLVTDISFKSRLANVTYVPAGDTSEKFTRLGLLIEDESDVAKRNGGRVNTIRGGTFADMDAPQTAMITVFAYAVGNTDFSVWSLHNVRLILTGDGRYVPVPYDFDWSGVVWARYARPAPQLGIKTVQDRLFRGPCLTPAQLAPVIAKFTEQRNAVKELYTRLPLDDGYRRKAMEYYDEFYRTIGDQRQVRRELIETCQGRETS